MKKILFVCTGNTCRSPMAAARFNKAAGERSLKSYFAESAGIAALEGGALSEGAEAALKADGIEAEHSARRVSLELMEGAALVYGLTRAHAAALSAAFPQCSDKIHAFPFDIPDPYGGSGNEYSECYALIKWAVDIIMSSLTPNNE